MSSAANEEGTPLEGKPGRRARAWAVFGFVLLVLGAIDPLEGSVVIVVGSALLTTGAFLSGSRQRRLLAWSSASIAIGVAAMFVLSAWGGIGGSSGHSWWWGLWILPYPLGWLLALIGALVWWARR